jgi:YQGE family putative transporter
MSLPFSLSRNERRLLLSFLLFIVAWPVFGTFTSTFLWRESQNFSTIMVFQIGLYTGLPLGFLLNSVLLHRFASKKIFFFGCILQGVGPLLLTLLHPSSLITILLLGACLGFPMGLYWGNRNLLTLCATEGKPRMYFLSRESSQNYLAEITIPILIGLFIARDGGEVSDRYLLVTILAFGLLLLASMISTTINLKIPRPRLPSLWITNASSLWNRLRQFEFLDGIITASEGALSLLIILTLLGLEDAVGGARSGIALLAAAMMFLFGRYVRPKDYMRMLFFSFLAIGISSLWFAITFNIPGAIFFFASLGFVSGFRSTSMMAVVYGATEKEVAKTKKDRFAYLLDRELFLNLGRLLVFFSLFVCSSLAPIATVRYGLLFTTLLHLPLLWVLKKIQKAK